MKENLWTSEDLKILFERGTIADLERLLADPARQYRAEFAHTYAIGALEKIADAEVLPDDLRVLVQRILALHKTATDPCFGLDIPRRKEREEEA